jgi:hypothetical protein
MISSSARCQSPQIVRVGFLPPSDFCFENRQQFIEPMLRFDELFLHRRLPIGLRPGRHRTDASDERDREHGDQELSHRS